MLLDLLYNTTNLSLSFSLSAYHDAVTCDRESAFRVAVEVENSKLGRAYKLVPHSEYSDCDWQTAYHGALAIATLDNNTYPPVIGVVGPACSGAAMSSVQPLKPLNISMVSFAATAEPITVDRAWFFNLFRTV